MKTSNSCLCFCTCLALMISSQVFTYAQTTVGINSEAALRKLSISGTGDQKIRVRTNDAFGGAAGLELVRGGFIGYDMDWKITNEDGNLKFYSGHYNNDEGETEWMHFDQDGEWGIGAVVPHALVTIEGGISAIFDKGSMILGDVNADHLVFDASRIVAQNPTFTADIHIQPYGGNTYAGMNSVDVNVSNTLSIGTTESNHSLTVADDGWQMYLRNFDGTNNDWYIGASEPGWGAGADQLVFSPNSTSSNSVFRLMSVTDNNGTQAPVILHTSATKRLLLDGNEIDTQSEPLYINFNSEEHTYINRNGAKVGIGTSNPTTKLMVEKVGGDDILALQRAGWIWKVNVQPSGSQDLLWMWDDIVFARVDGVSGQWSALSDSRLKRNIKPIPDVLDKMNAIGVYRYAFRDDAERRPFLGVLAQEIEQEFPEVVRKTKDQYGVVYGELAVLAIKAIKEQQQIIAELQSRIETLRNAR